MNFILSPNEIFVFVGRVFGEIRGYYGGNSTPSVMKGMVKKFLIMRLKKKKINKVII